MYRPPIPYHVDVPQAGALKEKIDFTMLGEASDVDSALPGDDHDSQMLEISRLINDEVNLEIAVRERLATTIEGRIQWALQMLDALSNVKELQEQHLDGDDFQDAALDALEALEAPSSFLFDNGLPEERSPSPSFSPIMPNQPSLQRVPKTRSSRTPKPSQQKRHLYIKLPSSSADSQLAILACPTCSRTQFTTLQGLLNHARLSHAVEWASHDACITACAVPVLADAQSWESCERDGVEVPWSGNVVGLRRLFERAVGVDGVLLAPLSAHTDASLESSTAPSTLLSRTLGLHADSPALAQFLGRAPKRRCIHVLDEDQEVDIMTLDGTNSYAEGLVAEEPVRPKKGFYMRFPHRNTARNDLDLIVDIGIEGKAETLKANNVLTPTTALAGTTASRFHITARIRLEDRSLFLKEEIRTQLGITDRYRWMLGVTAPSYSLPLSSFLSCVTVVAPRAVSPVFLTARRQPFAVVGTANEPFMAKVIFDWVGGGGKMEVEHWIELDQSRSSASVFGSEQLLDVELDRNIPLLPVAKGIPPPLPSLDRQLTFDSSLHNAPQVDTVHGETMTQENYEQVLQSLLPRVPMTARDVKSRATIEVPYRLVASPAHLLALVPGRRKAVEWARARTLHALYVDHLASLPPFRRTPLTVGDVYMFLEDASHFPRPSHPASGPLPERKTKVREKDGTPVPGEEACPTCGIKKRLHPCYDLKSKEGPINWTCAVVPTAEQQYGTTFPLINLGRVFTWSDGLEAIVRGPPLSSTSSVPNFTSKIFLPRFQHTPRDLLTLNPPEIILAVHKVASKLHLPTFPDFAPIGENRAFLTNKECAERRLAPAALLSAILKPFITTLLRSAIEIAKQDATSIVPVVKTHRGKRTKKLTFTLTPGHILRGLRLQFPNSLRAVPNVARPAVSCNTRARESTALCLARPGIRHDFGSVILSGSDTKPAEQSVEHATVKVEP